MRKSFSGRWAASIKMCSLMADEKLRLSVGSLALSSADGTALITVCVLPMDKKGWKPKSLSSTKRISVRADKHLGSLLCNKEAAALIRTWRFFD